MPTQIFVSITAEVRAFLDSCKASGAAEWSEAKAIDLDALHRLVAEHNDQGGIPTAKLHEVLAGAEVVDRKDREPECLTDVEKLRLQAEERKYQRSIDGVVPLKAKGQHSESKGLSDGMRFATNFATQVVVAFIGSFLFGYFFVETFVAPDNFSAKVIFGAMCSFVALLIETCLLVVREQKKQMISDRDAKLAAAKNRATSAAAAGANRAAATTSNMAGEATVSPLAEKDATEQCAAAENGTRRRDVAAPEKCKQEKKDD